ncbi:MAG: MarR family winged helix-turn-helix transcriptional regulator [Xanthobacteraceae bacterium]
MEKVRADRRGNSELVRHRSSTRGVKVAAKPSDLLSSKVIRLANVLRRSSTLVYGRRFGLSQVEWRIVALVGEHGPISLNPLAELMGLDKGQTSRGVSALVARRVVLREYRREGRGVRITLTTRGAQIYDELMTSALERNRVLLQGMSQAEKSAFFEILDRLTRLARTLLEREQNA